MKPLRILSLIFLLLIASSFFPVFAGDTIAVYEGKELLNIGAHIDTYADEEGKLSYEDILKPEMQLKFKKSKTEYPNFGNTTSALWCRFTLKKETAEKYLLEVGDPTIDSVMLYFDAGAGTVMQKAGNNFSFNDREFHTNLILFHLDMQAGKAQTFYMRMKSDEPLQFTLKTGTYKAFMEHNQKMDVIQGMYYGFMLVIVLYNLFLFISIRDAIYLYYVFYTAAICFTASFIKGYEVVIFGGSLGMLSSYPAVIYVLASVFSISFTIKFLQTKQNVPAWHKGFYVILPLHIIPVSINFMGDAFTAMLVFQVVVFISSLYLYTVGIVTLRKGYTPAKFYVWAWTAFLSGVIITVLKDNMIMPYNEFTNNAFQIGSSLEVLLLSFALADKINIYKREKRIIQKIALKASKENAKLVIEQNKLLEAKVKERTFELEQKNEELQKQKEELKELGSLKDKFFSILSHDVRGPLNSLHGIIGLLKKKGLSQKETDILLEDLSSTLSTTRNLLDNILHWAISHIKEGKPSISHIDLHETAVETIDILRYAARIKKIKIENHIPEGFMVSTDVNMVHLVLRNLLSNAIKFTSEEGTIIVQCAKRKNEIVIGVKDSGMGISLENQKKLFSAADNFSTKGTANEKGTGIGLVLCQEFLAKNKEKIWVESEEGKGSIFKFTVTDMKSEKIEA